VSEAGTIKKGRELIVTENFAREYWKDPAKAVGRRIRENPKAPGNRSSGTQAMSRTMACHGP
jgi:hypothetical protein